MTKRLILTFGGSYVKYKWESWPKYINWFTDAEVINMGIAACANETIWKKTIAECLKNLDRDLSVYVMWSPVDRYEVVSDIDQIKIIDEKITFSYIDENFNYSIWTGGHPDKEVNKYFIKNLMNEKQNFTRTLFYIFNLQNFFEVFNIDYKMMVWSGNVLENSYNSKVNKILFDKINFKKFLFYKDRLGLEEFVRDLYPQHMSKDLHPLPYAHYEWTKQIIFNSTIDCPIEEKQKLLIRTKQINEQK